MKSILTFVKALRAPRTIRKALTSAAGATASGLGLAALDGSLTGPEIVASIGAGVAFGFAAWRIPNEDVTP